MKRERCIKKSMKAIWGRRAVCESSVFFWAAMIDEQGSGMEVKSCEFGLHANRFVEI